VSFGSKLRTADMRTLAPVAFYGAVGVLFLVLLPFTNFPPHVGLTGILSLITAYSLFKKRFWAVWLVIALFFVATTFSLIILAYVMFSDWVVGVSLIAYAVLTWVFTAYTLSKRKQSET
jgi:hypothetical protein